MAGRPPKRTAQEALDQGDPGKRGRKKLRAKAEEAATTSGANEIDANLPVKPDFLTAEASKLWDRKLAQSPHLTAADSEVFADWCINQAQFEECQKVVSEQGFFRKNSNKTLSKREQVSLMKELRPQLLKLAEQLGFTPRARKTLGITTPKPKPNVPTTGTTPIRSSGSPSKLAIVVPSGLRS